MPSDYASRGRRVEVILEQFSGGIIALNHASGFRHETRAL